MSQPTEIFIFGASGHGAAMAINLAMDFGPPGLCRVAGFIDDVLGGRGEQACGKPVLSLSEWERKNCGKPVVVAVADPESRRRIVERLTRAGAGFPVLYRDHFRNLFPGVEVGAGTAISAQVYIGPFTRIGEHVQLMPRCSIGHDVEIGDFVTVCPGSVVSGNVVVESGVFIGAGATIVNGRAGAPLVIGRDSMVAAGSVVTSSLAASSRVIGNPAQPLREFVRGRSNARARTTAGKGRAFRQ